MIYFLGGGNMAAAIVSGLCANNRANEVFVANRGETKRTALAARFGVAVGETLPSLSADDVLILAVKPQDMQTACKTIHTNGALVVSLAAGLSVATLSHYLPDTHRMIRAMPNTPAQIGQGITGLFAPNHVNAQDRAIAQAIFMTAGQVVWLNDEAQMHAITAVSGSGSAYIFYLMNALQIAAQSVGFDATTSRQLVLQTFKGAVSLAEHSDEDLIVLQDNVTSKGGTTFAALQTFEQHHIAQYLGDGVQAALKRSRELSELFK